MCKSEKKRNFPEDKHVFFSGPKVLMTSLLAANLSVTSAITQPFCRCEFFPTSRNNIHHQHYPQFSPSTPNTKKGTFLKISVLATGPSHFQCPTPMYSLRGTSLDMSTIFILQSNETVTSPPGDRGNTRLWEVFTLGFLLRARAQERKKWGRRKPGRKCKAQDTEADHMLTLSLLSFTKSLTHLVALAPTGNNSHI